MRVSLAAFALFVLLTSASPAFGFCGFYVGGGGASLYNDATQVVLMRHNNTTVLSMQNNYKGPAENFAMVVPVPQVLSKENVKTLDKNVFDRVDALSAPRLVEYWERDPCQGDPRELELQSIGNLASLGAMGFGRGGGGSGFVKVEAQFSVGEYDIVVLSTNEAAALEGWLKENQYAIPDGAEPYFRPYVDQGMYFFVAKVDVTKAKYENGSAVLSPLRFHYESKEFSLPVRLGMINSKGRQDLLVYVLAENQRYAVANYPNVTIPTNIEVANDVRDNFGSFYEALYSRTVEENPKAVVTEYSWMATKCDPCPTGVFGGSGLQGTDLATLGNDILKRDAGWNSRWTLTRLHARYERDQIGEDLVFEKAEAIMGGRENRRDGELEKGSVPSPSSNNFQGRYIIRHEWEGPIACDEPRRGVWGGPPDPHGMGIIRDTVVAELRRQKAAAAGRELSEEDLKAPMTVEEEAAVGFHLRRKYGTSVAPASRGAGAVAATSVNTSGGSAPAAPAVGELATLIREAVPELKLEPAPDAPAAELPAAAPSTPPPSGAATPSEPPLTKAGRPQACAAAARPEPAGLLFWVGMAGWLVRRRTRRARIRPRADGPPRR